VDLVVGPELGPELGPLPSTMLLYVGGIVMWVGYIMMVKTGQGAF